MERKESARRSSAFQLDAKKTVMIKENVSVASVFAIPDSMDHSVAKRALRIAIVVDFAARMELVTALKVSIHQAAL